MKGCGVGLLVLCWGLNPPEFSRYVKKPMKNLTPFPTREGGKFQVSLPFRKRDLERGFPDTVKSQLNPQTLLRTLDYSLTQMVTERSRSNIITNYELRITNYLTFCALFFRSRR
jgi:hypothetical protein